MTARKVTNTKTTTSWVDNCVKCGAETWAPDPGEHTGYFRERNGELICDECRTAANRAAATEEWGYLVGRKVVAIRVSADAHNYNLVGVEVESEDGERSFIMAEPNLDEAPTLDTHHRSSFEAEWGVER